MMYLKAYSYFAGKISKANAPKKTALVGFWSLHFGFVCSGEVFGRTLHNRIVSTANKNRRFIKIAT